MSDLAGVKVGFMSRQPVVLVLLLLALSVPGKLHAESIHWELDGKVNAAVWSSNRSLDERSGIFPSTLALKGKVKLFDKVKVFADGRVGESSYFAGDHYGVAREFYLDYSLGNADIRLGKQLLPWGRADRINPTDSLTSRDYRWLAPEEEDQRFGNTGIRYAQHLDNYTLTGAWMPLMRSSRIPLDPEPAQRVAIHQPDNRDNFALKLDRIGEGLDWSLSFYSGVDTAPSLEQNLSSTEQPFVMVNHRVQRYGGDVAWAFGSYTLRSELAYTQTGKTNDEFSGRKYDYVQTVVGLEKQFANNLNLIVQAVWQSAFDWRGPSSWPSPDQRQLTTSQQIIVQQPARGYAGIAYRVSKRLFNDTLELELSGLGLTDNQGWLMRPRMRYQINDDLFLVLGGDYYVGDNNTFFGRLRDNRTVFLEFGYAFGTSS